MEFTNKDLIIIVSMLLSLIVISFLFPAIGFVSTDINQTDIPEYNTSNEAFDFLAENERPPYPTRPTEGTLIYVDNKDVYQDNRRVWLEGSTASGGYEVTLTNNGSLANPIASLFLNEYNETSFVGSSSTEMTEADNFTTLERGGYVISFENVTFQNEGQADMTMQVDWHIHETPAGSSTVGQIPIVGGIYSSTANAIAGIIDTLGWFGDIFLYYGSVFTVGTLGIFIAIYNIISFVTGIFVFLIIRYSSIIASAPASWAALLLSIPGVILSIEFMKTILIVISVIRGS